MYIKVEPSGCCERHGLVQIRLAMYLEPDDYAYERHHVQVPERPLTEEERADPKLAELVPNVWQNNPFHNHFIYGEPDITDDEIKAQMAFHLPNFYEAWCQDLAQVKGGMRHGWAVETRKHPIRYPENAQRKARCEARLVDIKSLLSQIKTNEKGETFPATEIDIGDAAIERTGGAGGPRTVINMGNPANDTGAITSVEIWARYSLSNCKVATFIRVSGSIFSTRDWEYIGNVASGSKRTFSALDMDVGTGDYIGIYYPEEYGVEWDGSGGSSIYFASYNHIPCTEDDFIFASGGMISVYGTGETLVSAPTVTTQAVDNIGTTTARGNGEITDNGGEDASAWGVCYNTTGNPTTADSVAAGSGAGGVGAFTAAMTGLTPGQHYYVKAYATNSAGTGYGGQVEFTTKIGRSYGFIIG